MKALTYAPLGLLAATLVWNCSDTSSSPVTTSGGDASPDTSIAPNDAGSDAHELPPPPPPPPGCKEAAKGPEPKDDACWISPAFGVFVAPNGVDSTAKGTQAAPFASVGAAMAALKANPSADRTRVFVCTFDYTEPTIELVEGIAVFGYFDCGSTDAAGRWKVDPDKHARVKSSSTIALHAKNIVKSTRINNMDFAAADAVSAGASSYGLFAEASSGLTFVASRIEAGAGAEGAESTGAVQLTDSGAAKNGVANRAAAACQSQNVGGQVIWTCPIDYGTVSAGGTNTCVGAGGLVPGNGGAGGVANRSKWTKAGLSGSECPFLSCFAPYLGTRTDGESLNGSASTALGGKQDRRAVDGASGAYGASGANGTSGILSVTGFTPSDGTAGTNGGVAQGGGGGAGDNPKAPNLGANYGDQYVGSTGGGGGAGGCPGLAGGVGKGGGASIGVFAVNSKILFDKTFIAASRGGHGGKGSPGSNRTQGGLAGTNHANDSMYSAGGAGGAGGRAGYSGSGASGPSFGIAWNGQKPVLQNSPEPAVGAPMDGVESISNDDGVTVPATTPGATESIHAF